VASFVNGERKSGNPSVEGKQMPKNSDQIDVYLEIAKKKTFAGALDWPGWSRSGRDEDAALEALLAYGPRYERAIQPAQLGFHSPQDVNALVVSERLEGNSTTDFGAPAIAPAIDADPVDPSELHRFQALLQACWQAFEAAVEQAKGKELRKGPRGGGRDLDKIVAHVLGAESAYLSRLGWKFKLNEETAADEELNRIQEEISKALQASVNGELPARGPRGGARWTPRYYVRRSAWHILDHAWEIEDRLT
jgi:hypothetical protein